MHPTLVRTTCALTLATSAVACSDPELTTLNEPSEVANIPYDGNVALEEKAAANVTVSIDPDDTQQTVTFGGDGKLSIKAWAEGDVETTAQRLFGDMDLRILRVPIFALQPIDDPIYDDVITVIQAVQDVNSDVKIFASVANGDGYGANHHRENKFPAAWRGCCDQNIYSLHLRTYASYLDSFIERMSDGGVTIDYLGPWNEDPADNLDYHNLFRQMDNLGSTQKVGVERWALLTSVQDVDDIEGRTDITGTHFFDQSSIDDADATWGELVDLSDDPVWYTESGGYGFGNNIDLILSGMKQVFPSIRSGAEAVIFYQVVKRLVWAGGGIRAKKYEAFKNLVNNSSGRQVTDISVSDSDVSAVSFADEDTLSVHFINEDDAKKTARINLQSGYQVADTITRTLWDAANTEVSNTNNRNGSSSWTVQLPPRSYTHFDVPIED